VRAREAWEKRAGGEKKKKKKTQRENNEDRPLSFERVLMA